MRVPLSYNPIDVDGLMTVLRDYSRRNHEELIPALEEQLRNAIGGSYVAAVQSGTAALHLALLAVGIRKGDYVMAPSFAYVASVSPIRYVDAIPVLIDSEELTWNMDPVLLEQAIEETTSLGGRVGAIVVVHNYGMPAQLDAIISIARRWRIPIIEDAAESLGSKLRGQWTGTLGDVGILSFNNNKTVTAMGGGAVISNNNEIIDRVRYLASHARSNAPYYLHEVTGFNYRMSPLEAAYGILQLANRDGLFEQRRKVYEHFRIVGEPLGLEFQKPGPGALFQPWLTACVLPERFSASDALDRLAAIGIESRRLWKPMHQQPAFGHEKCYLNGRADYLFDRGICLPTGNGISDSDIELTIRTVLTH